MLVVTQHGAYVSPDAVSYIGTARGLAAGDGFTTPPGTPVIGHFAPLYPAALAAGDALGVDPVDGARWLNAILLGLTVLVVGLVLMRSTGKWWPGLVGAVLAITATDALTYYSSALSDPMFALLCLLALVALAAYVERGRPLLLGIATSLTALALFTRYVGVALVVAGAVVLLLYSAGHRWRGALEAAAYSVVALVPVTTWVLWARRTHGHGTEGQIVWHLFGGSYLERGAGNLLEWVVPDSVPWWLGVLVVAAAIGLFVWAAGLAPRDGVEAETHSERLPIVCAVFAGAYVAVLLLDRLLLDASALLDKRFLLPLHLVAIVGLLALLGSRAFDGALKKVTTGAISVLVVLQLSAAAAWVYNAVDDRGARRGGYASGLWRDSSVVATVRNLPPGVPVYTNGPDAIWFLTGRATEMLPAEKDYLTGRSNPGYPAEITTMATRLRAGHGVVVYFPPIKSRPALPTVADLRRAIPLREVSSDRVGTIYEPSP